MKLALQNIRIHTLFFGKRCYLSGLWKLNDTSCNSRTFSSCWNGIRIFSIMRSYCGPLNKVGSRKRDYL